MFDAHSPVKPHRCAARNSSLREKLILLARIPPGRAWCHAKVSLEITSECRLGRVARGNGDIQDRQRLTCGQELERLLQAQATNVLVHRFAVSRFEDAMEVVLGEMCAVRELLEAQAVIEMCPNVVQRGQQPALVVLRSVPSRQAVLSLSMMNHPIHLHGMWSDMETGEPERIPRKHVIIVQPGAKISYLVTVDAMGGWAYDCHRLYQMLGMFLKVEVVS